MKKPGVLMFLRVMGIILIVLSLILLLAVPAAGIIGILLGIFFIFLSTRKMLPKTNIEQPSNTDEKIEQNNVIPFSGQRTREPFFHKEDGEVRDIAKLCIDKPDNAPEIIYIVDAWMKANGSLDVQKREVFETIQDAKEWFKDMGYKPVRDDTHMEELGLSAYKNWYYE